MTDSDRIINQHATYSMGAGILPIPFWDMAALSVIQMSMIKKLGELYNEDESFSKDLATKIVSTLIATVAPFSVARGALGTMVKSVPFVGPVLSIATFPAFCSASTIALGRVFDAHYKAGGDLITFNPKHYTDDFMASFNSDDNKV